MKKSSKTCRLAKECIFSPHTGVNLVSGSFRTPTFNFTAPIPHLKPTSWQQRGKRK